MRVPTITLISASLLLLSSCSARQVPPTTSGQDGGEAAESSPAAPVDTVDQPLPCPVDPDSLEFGAVPWTAENASERWGNGVTKVAEVRSSMARPIEVCGVTGQLAWLSALVCPDGKPAFEDRGSAHSARVGSMGSGGRCGTVVDAYEVPCSSGTVTVHMDLYHCAPDESLF